MNRGQLTFTVAQFCASHNISRSLYYELKKTGLAPKEIRVRRKVLISEEAASEWRRNLEKPHAAIPT